MLTPISLCAPIVQIVLEDHGLKRSAFLNHL